MQYSDGRRMPLRPPDGRAGFMAAGVELSASTASGWKTAVQIGRLHDLVRLLLALNLLADLRREMLRLK